MAAMSPGSSPAHLAGPGRRRHARIARRRSSRLLEFACDRRWRQPCSMATERVASARPANARCRHARAALARAGACGRARYVGHRRHNFPSCFVCGPERAPGDGLRDFPGDGRRQVAATWTPGADLAGARRHRPRRIPLGGARLPRLFRGRGGGRPGPARPDGRRRVERDVPRRRAADRHRLGDRQRGPQASCRDRAARSGTARCIADARSTWITSRADALR